MSLFPDADRDATPPFRRLVAWVERGLRAALVIGAGVVLGQQYLAPNKRVIPVIVAMITIGIAWRIDLVTGLGVLVLALPFPRGTVFGNTNLAFILGLVIIWLLRVGMRRHPHPRSSPLDLPLMGLLVMYIISFYNVRDAFGLMRATQNFQLFIGCLVMYYLILNIVRTPKDLERLHLFMLIGALMVFLVAIYELNHPASIFIRGWLDFSDTRGTEFNTRNVRIGSSFRDFELLSEFSVLTLLLGMLFLVRARSRTRKVVLAAFLVLTVFILFATVTRGAMFVLAAAVPYLMWLVRRHLRFVPLTLAAASVGAVFAFMNYFVATHTRSGDMFARLLGTHVVGGWMPDDRAGAWTNAWNRALVHPLIGQGPYYGPMPGFEPWWPHNVYLFMANIVGFVGLGFFLWILWKLFRLTAPQTDDLRHPDYAQAYLVVARISVFVFVCNEVKIDYARNTIYQFMVWLQFASWTAAALIAQAAPAAVSQAPPAPQVRAAA